MIAPYRDHSPFCRWLPAVHVHGRQEQVLHLRDRLLLQYCGKCTTRVVEWDGHPRVPVKLEDVAIVVEQTIAVGRETVMIKGS